MKPLLNLILLVFVMVVIGCNSNDPKAKFKISDFSTRATSTNHGSNEDYEPMMKVSFVEKCVTVLSANKVTEILLQTDEGEFIQENINKRSGVFCTPNDAKVFAVIINSESSKGEKFSKKFNAKAQ